MARAHGSYPWCRGFKSPFRYYRKRESERIPFCDSSGKETEHETPRGPWCRGAHEVRWTSVLRRPERSEDQIPLPRTLAIYGFFATFFKHSTNISKRASERNTSNSSSNSQSSVICEVFPTTSGINPPSE